MGNLHSTKSMTGAETLRVAVQTAALSAWAADKPSKHAGGHRRKKARNQKPRKR